MVNRVYSEQRGAEMVKAVILLKGCIKNICSVCHELI